MPNGDRRLLPEFHRLTPWLTPQTGRIVATAPLPLLTFVLALSLVTGVAAQEDATPTPAADTASETQATPVCDLLPVWLEFNTYERSWIRYRNVDSLGEPLLPAIDDMTLYPFRRINNGRSRVRISDLKNPDFVQSLATDHEFMYDEDLVDGVCDVAGLREFNSTDVLCKPGTAGMEEGYVFLVLYHPLTLKVAALTTSIDNTRGGALRDWSLPDRSASTDRDDASRPCGPFNEGQWIKAQSLDPDHGLTVSMKDVLWEVTDYQCVVPDDGQPYLQAYSIRHDLVGGSGCWCQDFNWYGEPCPNPDGCCQYGTPFWGECNGPHHFGNILRQSDLDRMTSDARGRLTIHGTPTIQ